MKKLLTIYLMAVLNVCGCSDNNDAKEKKDHVWKEQTDTIEKAKAVEGLLQESADAQRRQIQEQLE